MTYTHHLIQFILPKLYKLPSPTGTYCDRCNTVWEVQS